MNWVEMWQKDSGPAGSQSHGAIWQTVLLSEKSVYALKGPLYLDLPLFKMGLFCPDFTRTLEQLWQLMTMDCRGERTVKLPCECLTWVAAKFQLGSTFWMRPGAPAPDTPGMLRPGGHLWHQEPLSTLNLPTLTGSQDSLGRRSHSLCVSSSGKD